MRLEEFKLLVNKEFGNGLKHATPANVREFLDNLEYEKSLNSVAGRIEINEPCNTYEEVIKDFFYRVLDRPEEEAIMALWTLAIDLAFATIESQYNDRFDSMFKDLEQSD